MVCVCSLSDIEVNVCIDIFIKFLSELMPSVPRNFTGHVLDDTSVRLSWDKPLKNPGAVLGYLITYAVSGAHARRTVSNSDHSLLWS